MERYEKVKIIIDAIDSGISRKKIYPPANGRDVGKLHSAYEAAKKAGVANEGELYHGNGGVSDKLVDRMYENVLSLLSVTESPAQSKTISKPKNKKIPIKKVPREKSPSSPPQGVFIVLQKQVAQLEQQLTATHQQVSDLEQKAMRTKEELDNQCLQTTTLQEKVDALEKQRIFLQLENEDLWRQIDNKVDNESDQDLHGFCLTQRKAGTGLNKYWYAGKRINEKLVWVYIGLDKSKAEQKIEAWLTKHTQTRDRSQGDLF